MPMYAVSVDLAKAFDSVDCGLIWEVLACQSVPLKFLNALKKTAQECGRACLQWGGGGAVKKIPLL